MGYVIGIPGGSNPSHGGGGALGFVKNLVKDVGDAARGTPEGLVQLATHPVRTAENVGKQTWQDWSPLFHGHVGQFAHQVYDHPLAPMLDIATAFTGPSLSAVRQRAVVRTHSLAPSTCRRTRSTTRALAS
jgi:hypothetical protein